MAEEGIALKKSTAAPENQVYPYMSSHAHHGPRYLDALEAPEFLG